MRLYNANDKCLMSLVKYYQFHECICKGESYLYEAGHLYHFEHIYDISLYWLSYIHRSTNSVSLSLRSTSPTAEHQLLKQQNPVSSSQPSNLTATVANNDRTPVNSSSDNKPAKRKSLSDVALLQANLTHASIKHDLRQVYLDYNTITSLISVLKWYNSLLKPAILIF